MPYDNEGNYIYPGPRPARSNRSKPAAKPAVSAVDGPALKPASSLKIPTLPVLPEKILPVIASSQPSLTAEQTPGEAPDLLLVPETNSFFTIQDDSNRWQMSELDLAQIWNSQLWPEGLRLVTVAGQAVEVVYRGRWSGGYGPDFKDALVRVGSDLLKGDIELHLRSGDWRLHGHQQDARYNGVVLQVALEDNSEPGVIRTQAGQILPALALLPLFQQAGASLSATLGRARESGTRLGSMSESAGPCCESVAARYTDLPVLLARIDGLGLRRFEERAARYEAACSSDADQSAAGAIQELWSGIVEALGYSQNKTPFRRLAQVLPLARLLEFDRRACRQGESRDERTLTLEAALLGAAGLLPSQRGLWRPPRRLAESSPFFEAVEEPGPLEDLPAGQYLDELERRWAWLSRQLDPGSMEDWRPMDEQDWVFARIRPPNHPSRRLAGLARLLSSRAWSEPEDLLETLVDAASALPEEACQRLKQLFRVGLEGEDSDGAAFWSQRYDFGDRALLAVNRSKAAPADLIGSDRAADIVVNVVLPFLAAYGRDRRQPELTGHALAAYAVHPRTGSNELVENVARQVFKEWLEGRLETPAGKSSRGQLQSKSPGQTKSSARLTISSLVNGACRQQGLLQLHHQYCAEHNYSSCPLA